MIVADISRTVLRRSELKSRTVLMNEQFNPWKLMHLQDTAIQHRICVKEVSPEIYAPPLGLEGGP